MSVSSVDRDADTLEVSLSGGTVVNNCLIVPCVDSSPAVDLLVISEGGRLSVLVIDLGVKGWPVNTADIVMLSAAAAVVP